VTEVTDISQKDFFENWSKFIRTTVQPGSIVTFFFAGHGLQLDKANYLLPADAPSTRSPESLKHQSISFADLASELQRVARPNLSLFILNACRSDPLPEPERNVLGMEEPTIVPGGPKGLAAQESPPKGVFIMYSANAGELALDRLPNDPEDQQNSVYMRKLIPLLKRPRMTLVDIARSVRREVQLLAATVQHEQYPAYYDGVREDVCLNGDCRENAAR
jgi:uncharacterized caspase-like protein